MSNASFPSSKHDVRFSARSNNGRQSEFLQALRVDHGPVELLGRFFLKAEASARVRGLELYFASFEELARVNAANRRHWAPLLPMFQSGAEGLSEASSFCILGRNAAGEVVATQAARFYQISESNLLREAESLRLFYGRTTPPPPQAICKIRSSIASTISGRVAYSGCGWYRPDYRGLSLSAILPRISRAYAFTRWNTHTTVSFINVALIRKGVAARYGYTNLDGEVRLQNVFAADFLGAVAWMERNELMRDLEVFLTTFGSQIDGLVDHGGGHKIPRALRA